MAPWCPQGIERFPELQAGFISGHATSGAVASLSYSPGICKSDVNVAFGAAMVLGLFVLASSMQSHSRMVCPLVGRAAVVPDGGEGGCGDSRLPSCWVSASAPAISPFLGSCPTLPPREHGSWAGWPCLRASGCTPLRPDITGCPSAMVTPSRGHLCLCCSQWQAFCFLFFSKSCPFGFLLPEVSTQC